MTAYILRRILITIPLLLGLSILVFALIQLAPGDPSLFFLSSTGQSAVAVDVEQLRAEIREELGLDRPVHIQYLAWLSNAIRGDFGYAFTYHVPVSELIAPRVWPTVQLQLAALLLAVGLALPLGVISAVRQYSVIDHVITSLSFMGLSLPNFWLALLLILLLSIRFDWLPSSGTGADRSLLERIPYFIMPVVVLAAGYIATYVRFMRSSMLDVLNAEFVTMARAKGLPERVVLFRHALRNALLPMVTVIGLSLSRLIGGAIIVETIFAWHGLGRLAYDAVLRRDQPVIMAVTLLVSVAVILSNLLVDVIYVFLDPRISYTKEQDV